MSFPRIDTQRKTGEEAFHSGAELAGFKLRDFWQWAASDLVSNAMRGVLAEYIVANALGLAGGIRTEWDAYDLLFNDRKIEVKSASYIQSWNHQNLSKITFGIRPTRGWDAETNTSSDLRRQADVYVFCLLAHKDQDTLDPLDLNQWEFYVLSSEVLNRASPDQKTISLASLLRLNPLKIDYSGLSRAVMSSVAITHP
jgi:hypothetical protein